MAHSWLHAKSSARKFGGKSEDYIAIHDWFDGSKELVATWQHRALRHHTQGIFEAERVFGHVIVNSDGKEVPVRVIGEQHVAEDFNGFIPTLEDWLKNIEYQPWMQPNAAYMREFRKSIEV